MLLTVRLGRRLGLLRLLLLLMRLLVSGRVLRRLVRDCWWMIFVSRLVL